MDPDSNAPPPLSLVPDLDDREVSSTFFSEYRVLLTPLDADAIEDDLVATLDLEAE